MGDAKACLQELSVDSALLPKRNANMHKHRQSHKMCAARPRVLSARGHLATAGATSRTCQGLQALGRCPRLA